nr:MBL fold metallo-hydrolase [Nitrospiraceae bacterium]
MEMIKDIHWLGHDTFRIQSGGKILYTDPFRIGKTGQDKKADLILITHEHYDHCSPEDVGKIAKDGTVVICPAGCADKFREKMKTMAVKPGDRMELAGVGIEAVPAYNTNKKFHPRENQWVGYIFSIEGKRIYIAGDTDYIPEMRGFKADIALLPVSGTYVMTAEEAARAALDMNPGIAIP